MTEQDNGNPSPAARGLSPLSIPRTATVLPKIPLGEELPLFCERCGYSLNGLAQIRCDHCRVLHFSCPECDHHQPINTLRPAVLRTLGRLRALGLALLVFVKINVLFWSLFLFGVAGMAISYNRSYYNAGGTTGYTVTYEAARVDWEGNVILFMFGGLFGMVARMLLLRWRHGVLVGLVLGALVMLAMAIGAEFQRFDSREPLVTPYGLGFLMYMAAGGFGGWFGSTVVWGIWLALVTAFLPRRASAALLAWQTAMSAPRDQPDRTDATTSVTA